MKRRFPQVDVKNKVVPVGFCSMEKTREECEKKSPACRWVEAPPWSEIPGKCTVNLWEGWHTETYEEELELKKEISRRYD